jgi:hypothetical protein
LDGDPYLLKYDQDDSAGSSANFDLFDNSVREKDWRCRNRGAQAT